MVTKEQAMAAAAVHVDGAKKCQVWRRNGVTQTWKRDETRFRMPVKYGMYAWGAVTQDNGNGVHLPEDCPHKH